MAIYNVQLYADCGETVKRVALELGGNAPFIVFKVDSIICNLTLNRIRHIFLQSNNFGLTHPPCIPCSINLTIITLKKNINNPNFSPTVSRLGQGSSRYFFYEESENGCDVVMIWSCAPQLFCA